MKEYRQFVDELQTGLNLFLSNPRDSWKELAIKYVNGFAADELRRLISLEKRRGSGAFFTNATMAYQISSLLRPTFDNKSVIYDPACGAGNLLISAFDTLSDLKLISETEKQFLGTDIYDEFIEAAKLRLKINSLLKKYKTDAELKNTFEIHKADGLQKNEFYKKATHILVNPPFNLIDAPEDLEWAKGKVSAAGVFIDKIIQNSNPNISIVAILPDVLRSGSRYDKWRKLVQETCKIDKVELLGQFDRFADVDVFALKLTKKDNREKPAKPKNLFQQDIGEEIPVISDLFDVCVGSVVDNRDPKEGIPLGYIVSKKLKGWGEKNDIDMVRKHEGKSFPSPFVVIKRTSRKGDSSRAIATIINMPQPVYVDNHLIILKPKSGAIDDCQKAISILKNKKTDDWLNSQIRCRHLTVSVVSKIPLT